MTLYCSLNFSSPLCTSLPVAAQRDIEQAKKNWELGHLQSLKEEEERLAEEEFNNIMLTYDRPETVGKVVAKYGLRRLTSNNRGSRPERKMVPGQHSNKLVGSQRSFQNARNEHSIRNHSKSRSEGTQKGKSPIATSPCSCALPKRHSSRVRTSPASGTIANPSPRRTRK